MVKKYCDCCCAVLREEINKAHESVQALSDLWDDADSDENNDGKTELNFRDIGTAGAKRKADPAKEVEKDGCSAKKRAKCRAKFLHGFEKLSNPNPNQASTMFPEYFMRISHGLGGREAEQLFFCRIDCQDDFGIGFGGSVSC